MQERKARARPGVNDEGFLLCPHCGELDFDHIEKYQDETGTWLQRKDGFGSVYRKPCSAAIEKRFQGYYSDKLKQCKKPGPPETPLWSKLARVNGGYVELPFPNALIFSDLDIFQTHFKTFLRNLHTGRLLQYPYIDTVHIPRLKDIKFGKDQEFKTFDELDKYDLVIIDLGIETHESVMDAANVGEFLAIRRYLTTWLIVHPNARNLSKNIPNDVQDEIRSKFVTVNLETGGSVAPPTTKSGGESESGPKIVVKKHSVDRADVGQSEREAARARLLSGRR